MKAAVLQTNVSVDKEENLRNAAELIGQAAEAGAALAILPELFVCPYKAEYLKACAEPAGGRIWKFLSDTAKENRIAVVGGSMPEADGDLIYNTSFVFDSEGRQIARHRKLHLFDISFRGGQTCKESDNFGLGRDITTFDLGGMRFGLCICFDIRFPELTRIMALRGAQCLIVPASFSMTTGPLHWDLLFRQRAADDQVYTIGCAPARDEAAEYVSYSNSIVCDPMGRVIAHAGTAQEVLCVEIDPEAIAGTREQLPLITARRTDVYQLFTSASL